MTPEQLINQLGIGLPFGLLHRLSHKETQDLASTLTELLHSLRIGGDNLHYHLLQSTFIRDLAQPFLLTISAADESEEIMIVNTFLAIFPESVPSATSSSSSTMPSGPTRDSPTSRSSAFKYAAKSPVTQLAANFASPNSHATRSK